MWKKVLKTAIPYILFAAIVGFFVWFYSAQFTNPKLIKSPSDLETSVVATISEKEHSYVLPDSLEDPVNAVLNGEVDGILMPQKGLGDFLKENKKLSRVFVPDLEEDDLVPIVKGVGTKVGSLRFCKTVDEALTLLKEQKLDGVVVPKGTELADGLTIQQEINLKDDQEVAIRMVTVWDQFAYSIHANLVTESRWWSLVQGLGVTLYMTVGALLIGTILGVLLCILKISKNKIISKIVSKYIDIMRGTPLVVQLMIFTYVIITSPIIPREVVGIIAFGLNSSAYIAELLRGGILAVNQGQTEAGRSLGLSQWQTMILIILPQAVKNALPAYTSECIVLVKETAVAGYIAINDLTKVADSIRSRTYDAFVPLLITAGIYYWVTSLLTKLFGKLERRMRESDKR